MVDGLMNNDEGQSPLSQPEAEGDSVILGGQRRKPGGLGRSSKMGMMMRMKPGVSVRAKYNRTSEITLYAANDKCEDCFQWTDTIF